MTSRLQKRDVVVIAFLLVAGSLQGWSNRHYYLDDAFIVLRIGRNLAAGQGFSFNPGERVNSSTSVLNPLAAAAAHLLLGDQAQIGMHVLDDASFLALAVLSFLLIRASFGTGPGALAGAIVLFDPLLRQTYGLETPFFLALAVLTLFFLRQQWPGLGVVLGLLSLARPDGLLLAGLLFGLKYYQSRRFPAKETALLAAVLLPWLLFSWWYFGAAVPHTLTAKMAQGSSGFWRGTTEFAAGLVHTFHASYPGNAGKAAVLALAGLGVAVLIRRRSLLLVLLLWAGLLLGFYLVLGVPGYHWYYAPLFLSLDVTVAAGAAGLYEGLRRKPFMPGPASAGSPAQTGAALALSALLLTPVAAAAPKSLFLPLPAREEAYKETGLWIKSHTPPHDRLAAVEIGTVGYYSERPVIDPLGLVATPELCLNLSRAYERDWTRNVKPELILIHQAIWPVERAWLTPAVKREYELWHQFEFPRYRNLLLLRRRSEE